MIIYNVTIKINGSVYTEWFKWLKEIHIPDVMQTGCFIKPVVLKLLDTDETEGPTYAIQYTAQTKSDYDRYIENYAGEMRKRSFEKWGDKFIAFRSVMEIVD